MRFSLPSSRLFKGIGVLLAVPFLLSAMPAAAGPVRVAFSGHLDTLPTDPPFDTAFPGNVVYETEILAELPEGSLFSGSFLYDPLAPATTTQVGPSAFLYEGLISSVNFMIARAGGGYFTGDGAGEGLAVNNDYPSSSGGYSDALTLGLGYLSPAFPGIPGAPSLGAGLGFADSTTGAGSFPDLVSDTSPPLDLIAAVGRADSRGFYFTMETGEGRVFLPTLLDSLTFTPVDVPEPAPIGLMLLGMGYTLLRRRRLRA